MMLLGLKMTMVDKKKNGPGPGAGFILVKGSKNKKILALINHDGSYDLPKGALDKEDNSFLDCAKRECYEECGIRIKSTDLIKSVPSISSGKLVVFTATTQQKPKITKNPHTGILEHSGSKWVTTTEFKANSSKFLADAITQFENYIFLF